jgi:hypothetical protein
MGEMGDPDACYANHSRVSFADPNGYDAVERVLTQSTK